jgi:hypothetical protein
MQRLGWQGALSSFTEKTMQRSILTRQTNKHLADRHNEFVMEANMHKGPSIWKLVAIKVKEYASNGNEAQMGNFFSSISTDSWFRDGRRPERHNFERDDELANCALAA